VRTTPLGYIDFMNLVSGCTIAITDSGGVQEEDDPIFGYTVRKLCRENTSGRLLCPRERTACLNRMSWRVLPTTRSKAVGPRGADRIDGRPHGDAGREQPTATARTRLRREYRPIC